MRLKKLLQQPILFTFAVVMLVVLVRASIPGASGSYTACIVPSGQLRVIDAGHRVLQ